MSNHPHVCTGLEVLRKQSFAPLKNLRIGLVTHPAAVDAELRHSSDIIRQNGATRLVALFGPEHGYQCVAQDLVGVKDGVDSETGLRIHSLYGDRFESLTPSTEQLRDIDALVIDLQDVGSRYYTFACTMYFCLEAASKHGLLSLVLDRPNPLGGDIVEGPTLDPRFRSFIGWAPMPIRHGMTMGELARMYHSRNALKGELRVISCEGWRRDMYFDQTGLPWVMPSPNMPTLETALVYPGQCLLEGTNISEGRGTTRPFELCGSPTVDARELRRRLEEAMLPGVGFRECWFEPTFQKFVGQTCAGVQLHVFDRTSFQPVRTSLNLITELRTLSGGQFDWRREPYEFVADRLAIDLLFGSGRERTALEAGESARTIANKWLKEETAFAIERRQFLLY